MKKRLRTCTQCGTEENTFSRTAICLKCTAKNKTSRLVEAEKAELEQLGYSVVSGPTYDAHNHRKWKVITPCCKTEYEPLVLTIRSMLERTGTPPCLNCGGKTRMASAMKGYIAKHGITYDVQNRQDYTKLVRGLSNKTLDIYGQFINPENLDRGTSEHHLDHRVPIIWCFKHGIPPELAALCTNLQMLPAEQNLKKGSSNRIDTKLSLGLDVLNVLDYGNPVFDVARMNLWPHQLKTPALSGMVLYRQGKCNRVHARTLDVREVPPAVGKVFMERSHLAGDVPASHRIGLWKDDILLVMMSLGASRFSKKHAYEVLRFATAPGYAVSGAASRLFKRVRRDLDGPIICYSDNQIGTGSVYQLAGLQYDGETGSGYFWEKNGVILQRHQTQKHKLAKLLENFDSTQTESELMIAAGWRKVQTMGNKRWLL